MQGFKVFAAVFVVLVACGTSIALAAESDPSASTASQSSAELPSKRTATSDTYELSDGARETRIFENPINYREEGEWKPIGEELEEANGGRLTNGANSFDLSLPAKMGAGAVRLSEDNQWVSYKLLGEETEAAELEEGIARYEVPGSGPIFDLTGLANGVKEEIELTDSSQPSSFRFALDAASGLSPSIAEDGSLVFRDDEGEVFASLPAPTVSDSSSNLPSASGVGYSLQERPEGGWLLTLEVSQDWLSRPDRSWPVTIDPTLTVEKPSLDCAIGSLPSPEGWHACSSTGAQSLYAAYSQKEGQAVRSLLRFDVSSIPSSAEVANAVMTLTSPAVAENTTAVQVRRLTKTWQSTLNWLHYAYDGHKNTNLWATPGGDYTAEGAEVLTSQRGTQAGPWEFSSKDLTHVVRGWVSHGIENQGLLVKNSNESKAECEANPEKCNRRFVEFYSGATVDSKNRPKLSVTYYPKATSDSKVTSPIDGTRSARRFKLQAAWNHAGVTGVYFQYKSSAGWIDVPANKVIDKNNQPVQWPLPIEGGAHQSPPVYWDAQEANVPLYVIKGNIRAILVGTPGADGYTAPVEVQLNREIGGTKDATTSIGPGTVNLLTGNFTVSRTDVSIPAFGSALEFTRTHNSRDVGSAGDTTVLGRGWKPGVAVEAAGGAQWRSVKLETATVEEENEAGEIVKVPIGEYALLTDLEGYEYAFEKVGELFVTPPEASGLALTKEGSNFVFSDPAGNRTTFSNGGSGNEYLPIAVTQTGGASNSTQMVYQIVGGNRRLSMIIAPTTPELICNEANAKTTLGCRSLNFTYEPATKWGAPGADGERLASITYYGPSSQSTIGSWQVAAYKYNAEGRLVEEWDPRITPTLAEAYTYEPAGQLRTITPPGQEPWTLEYGKYEETSLDGRLVAVKRASLISNPSVAQTTVAYGVPVTGSGAPYEMGGIGVAKWGQQDIPTDATAIFPPDEVPSSSPPSSYARATVYYTDAEGQLVNTATPSGAGTEAPSITTSETDEHGNVVRELSAQNRLRALAAGSESVTKSHELETKRLFNVDGTQVEEEWGPMHQVRLESGTTKQARLHKVIQYDEGWPGTGVKPHLPTRETTGASIPGQGIDADQRVTETRYDWTLRKPIETIVDPLGLNLHTRIAYDAGTGLPTERSLPAKPSGGDAHTTKTIYYQGHGGGGPCTLNNAWAGLPCKVEPAAQPGTSGQPELLVTTYAAYNAFGEPTEIIESPGGSSQNQRKTIITYDTAGRETSKRQEGGGTSLPKVETLYNAASGLPTTHQFVCEKECSGFDSQATITTYDALGRVKEYQDADGNTAKATYDLDSRPVTSSDNKETQTRTYDPTSGLLTKLEDSGAGTFTAAYDANGNLTEEGLPDGLVAKTTYNETDEPTHLSYEKKTFCSLNCTWLDYGIERSIYGQIFNETSLTTHHQYGYDKAGRLILAEETPTGGECTTRSYSYDADSNRTALVTRAPGIGGVCDISSKGTTQSYGYDAGDRLTTPSGIAYDNFGRITSLPGEDAGGSTLTTSYYSNDQVATQSQGGISNSFQLDSTGRERERVQTGGSEPGTEIYHYDGALDSPAWAETSSGWTRQISGIGGGLVAIQSSSKGTTLQLCDPHGNIAATASIDPEATKLLTMSEYDEFGNPKQSNTPQYGWLGGKGRRTQLPSGVVQMGARSYVPAIGRFLSIDSVPGGSANSYDYANADPVNGLDLAGTSPSSSACTPGFAGCQCKMWAHLAKGSKRGTMYLTVVRKCNRTGGVTLQGRAAQWYSRPNGSNTFNQIEAPRLVYPQVQAACTGLSDPCQNYQKSSGLFYCEPGKEYQLNVTWGFVYNLNGSGEEHMLHVSVQQRCPQRNNL